jgi:hypothetical protein
MDTDRGLRRFIPAVLVLGLLVPAGGVLLWSRSCPATGDQNFRAAQSNLTNALTEAASQYENNNQSYSAIRPVLVASAPEFTWIDQGPALAGTNDISMNACVDGPACQAVELAAAMAPLGPASCSFGHSIPGPPGKASCWAAIELSTDPTPELRAAGIPSGGTFYGVSPMAGPTSCTAGTGGVPTRPASGWQDSYSAASQAPARG